MSDVRIRVVDKALPCAGVGIRVVDKALPCADNFGVMHSVMRVQVPVFHALRTVVIGYS